MADITKNSDIFRERKKLEDIFLEYKPYSLSEVLNLINVVEQEEETNELDDEVMTIDLKETNKNDIEKAIAEEDNS